VRFLRFLAPRLEDLPVLLALGSRPSAAQSNEVEALIADPAARVLLPRPLTRSGVATYVRRTLSAQADDGFCAACAETSGGNPFLLRELVTELAAEGRTGSRDEVAHVRDVAPASISRAVLVRLARLPDAARRLAEAVAVLGDDAAARHAAALAGLEVDAVAEAADALAMSGVFEHDRSLRFTHPVVRNAVYADLPVVRRALLHGRVARMLSEEGAEPERVGVHLLATEPAGDAHVVETLIAAGRRAIARAAPETAVRYLRRALAEPTPPPLRRTVLVDLLTAGFRAADLGALDGVDPVAELSGDTAALIDSAPMLGGWLLANGRPDEMAKLLERAAAAAREAGAPDTATYLDAQWAFWTRLPPRDAYVRVSADAECLVPGSAGERLLLAASAWWTAFKPDGTADEAAALAQRAVAGGEIFSELPGLPHGAQAILVLIRAEQLDPAGAALERAAAVARAHGGVIQLAGVSYLSGELSRVRGDVARAAAEARTAVQVGREGGFLATFPTWIALLVETLIELDELAAADAELEANGMTGVLPATYWHTPVRFSRAHLRMAQGRPREAVEDLLTGARDLERLGMVNAHYPWGAMTALCLDALGRHDEARAQLERALATAETWGAPSPIAAARRAHGLISGGEEGRRALQDAIDVAPPGLERTRGLIELGAALRRANRRREGREPLRAALELARRGGAVALARRARDELVATGERVRPLGASGVESLTPSERRVATLAASGQSNREIAQALFLTVKTIETHLSNTYRKLEVRSRRDLAAALRDE
jgi:DNA-binding CsgD family transcriptional regulator